VLDVPDLFLFLLGVLSVYRLAVLIAIDDGPGDWCVALRTWLGAYEYREDPTPRLPGASAQWRARSNLGRAISCPRCLSMWVAIPVALLLFWHTGLAILVVWLALSGGAIWLWEVTNRE
jgi:hypothetical protein